MGSEVATGVAEVGAFLVCTDPAEFRGRILALEKALEEFPQIDLPLAHHHAPGMYARELTIPAGTIIVGKIHRTEHLFVLLRGSVTVVTESGLERLEAPQTRVTPIGTKRLIYAHTDATWTTFHPTQETDLDKIEEAIIAPTFETIGLEVKEYQLCLGSPSESPEPLLLADCSEARAQARRQRRRSRRTARRLPSSDASST